MSLRPKSVSLFVLVLFAGVASAHAFLDPRFAVDFSSPPHVVGQPPSQGDHTSPSNGVPRIIYGKPTVVAAFGPLNNQPLEFRSSTTSYIDYSQIEFPLGNESDYVVFETDLCIKAGGVHQSQPFAFIFDTPEVRTVTFEVDGQIRSSGGRYTDRAIGRFNFGEKYHLSIHVNLRAQTWRIAVNGVVLDSAPFGATVVKGLRINLAGATLENSGAAIDNVVINSYWGTPSIVEGPRDQTLRETDIVTFGVVASGDSSDPVYKLKYQWLLDGMPIAGATADKLILDGVKKSQAGVYSVKVTSNNVSTTSDPARLTVLDATARLQNISTRLDVGTNERALIGGFILQGIGPKKVILRAIGPSLNVSGLPINGRLLDPILELYNSAGAIVAQNDNWRDAQEREIIASTIPPSQEKEAAIVADLASGSYTAMVRGVNNTTGVGLVEVYELSETNGTKLMNVSTRGQVESSERIMIGGFIFGGPNSQPGSVLVRALGPTLQQSGLTNALADPELELRNGDGDLVASNRNWRDTEELQIQATGLPPIYDTEAAIVSTLGAGNYTALVRGEQGGTGLALIEIYRLTD